MQFIATDLLQKIFSASELK